MNKSRFRRLSAELLEERTVPVIGATAVNDAPAVIRGQAYDGINYDGVVYVTDSGKHFGTGSLLDTRRHILTAAHVFMDSDPSKPSSSPVHNATRIVLNNRVGENLDLNCGGNWRDWFGLARR